MSRTQVVHRTVLVAGGGMSGQQRAHPEPHTVVIPPAVEPARPRTVRNGGVEQVDRVAGLYPPQDRVGGDRFREKLGAALAAAAAGMVFRPRRDR